MESIEKKYKKLVDEGEVEKARAMVRSQFEEVIRKNTMRETIGKEGHVFIVRGKSEEDPDFKVLEEFDNADEARDWYDSNGTIILADGGKMYLEYGPSELKN